MIGSVKRKFMKVAVVGSREYENKRKIKDFIFEMKQKFGDDLVIISGGCPDGADKYAKKFSLELGVRYQEFNPAHTTHNLYSAMPEKYYGKPYHVSQFHHRNQLIAKACDVMACFIPDSGDKASGTESAIKAAKKLGKNVVILN